MKILTRGLFFGLVVGVIIGWLLAEKQHEREKKAASENFANDPEVQAIMAESRRLHQTERWIDEFEKAEEA